MPNTSYGTPYVQSSDLVSGWPNASLNVANRIDEVSYAGNGINAQTVTSYTLVVGDAGKTVTLSNAAAVAVTLPQDSVANLPTGAVVNFYNLGAGAVTISAGAGATLQGGSLTAAQYGYAAVIKLSANTYGPYQPVPTTPGLAIITPTSIANSGGSASASGGAVTYSGVSSISLNGVFSATYEHYMLTWSVTGSTGQNMYLRMRASGTDATTSYYYRRCELAATYTTASGASTYMEAGYGRTNVLYNTGFLFSPYAAAYTQFQLNGRDSSGTTAYVLGTSDLQNTTAYDGVTLFPNTGTISGVIRVYGMKN